MQKIKQILKKIKTWFVDHYHLIFKSAADNHLRIQQILKNTDGSYQLTVKFDSYSELKSYQKKLRRLTVSLSSAIAMVVVAVIVAPYVMNPNRSSAANFQWKQSSWTGGVSASLATKTGWTNYASLAGVVNGAALTSVFNNSLSVSGRTDVTKGIGSGSSHFIAAEKAMAKSSNGTVYVVYASPEYQAGTTNIAMRSSADDFASRIDITTNTNGTASGASIFVDVNDKIHIAYYSKEYNATYSNIAYRNNVSGNFTARIDVTTNTTRSSDSPTFALDSAGKVHIAYISNEYNSSNFNLAYRNNVSGSFATRVDLTTSTTIGSASPSLAIDSADKVHIVYSAGGIQYKNNTSGSFGMATTVAAGGSEPSMVIDSLNYIHVAYISNEYNASYANVAYRNNISGSFSARVDVTTNTTKTSRAPVLRLDSTGKAHIIYSSNEYNASQYYNIAYRSNVSGNFATRIDVATNVSGTYAYKSSMMDAAGKIHVVYQSKEVDPTYYNIAYRNNVSDSFATKKDLTVGVFAADVVMGANGSKQVVVGSDGTVYIVYLSKEYNSTIQNIALRSSVDNYASRTDITTGTTGIFAKPSIAIDSNNKIHVAYQSREYSASSDNIAYRNNVTGSFAARVDVTTNAGISSESPSLVIDSSGKAHVAYDSVEYNASQYNIAYRNNISGNFATRVDVTTNTTVVSYAPSLAIDTAGKAHVAYMSYEFNLSTTNIAYRSNVSGGFGARIDMTTSATISSEAPSLVVDAAGKAHAAYYSKEYNATYNNIVYRNNVLGSFATRVDVTSNTTTNSTYPSLSLDSGGKAHVSYISNEYNSTYSNIAYRTNITGNFATRVDITSNTTIASSNPSSALDTAGKAHIAYLSKEYNAGLLNVAYRSVVLPGYSSGSLTSSTYNTLSANNAITGLNWKEDVSIPSGTGVTLSLATGSSSATLGAWTNLTSSSTGCSKDGTGLVTCGIAAIPVAMRDNSGDQYVAYKVDLATTGVSTATVDDVAVVYSYNVPPAITINTNPANLKQNFDGTFSVPYTLSETYDDFGSIAHGTAASPIKANLFYQPKSDVTLPVINDSYTGNVTFNNPSSMPIPKTGSMLVDSELILFDDNSGALTGNQRRIVAPRGATFATSYPTTAVSHVANSPVFFLASVSQHTINTLSATGTIGAQATVSNSFSWNPKADANSNLNNSKLDGVLFKVVANDADSSGVNNIGQSSVTSSQILDLQSPAITTIVADLSTVSEPEKSSGIFGIGKTIPVKVTFSESVTTVGDVNVKLDMGSGRISNCTINIAAVVNNKTCNVTVNEGDSVADLSLITGSAVIGTIKDAFSNQTIDPASPTKKDLSDSPDIKVDGVKPTVTSVTETSNNTNNKKAKPGDEITLSIATSEILKSGTVPTVTIASHSAIVTGSGNPYTAKYTFAATDNIDTEGALAFSIGIIDTAGNINNPTATQDNTSINDGAVVFDRTKPTLSNISAVSNNTIGGNKKAKVGDTITLTFTASETLKTPSVKIARDTLDNLKSADLVTNVGQVYTATYQMQAGDKEEDIPYVIEFEDEAGNTGDATNGNTEIIFDRTKPNVAEKTPVTTPTSDKTPEYTFTTNEAGTITYSGGCVSITTDAVSGDNIITFTELADGTYSACNIKVTDIIGNESSEISVSSFEIDTIGKDIAIVTPQTNDHLNSMEIKFSFQEVIQNGNITLTDQDAQQTVTLIDSDKYGADTEYSQIINGLGEGTYAIEINATDLAGNSLQSANKTGIVYDTTAPTISVTTPEYFNNFSDQSDISFNISNNSETLKDGKITFEDSANVLPDAVCNLKTESLTDGNHTNVILDGMGSQCNEVITLVDAVKYDITFSATDLATNAASTIVSDKTFDITPPTLQYFKSTTADSTVDSPQTSGDVNVTAVYNEPIADGGINVKMGPMSATVNIDLASNQTNDLSGQFTIGAPRTGYDTTPDPVKVEVISSGTLTDRAGNTRTYANSAVSDEQNMAANGSNIIIDTTPPILQKFTIEGGGGKTAFNSDDSFTLVANYNKTIQAGGNVEVVLNTGSAKHAVTLSNALASKKLIAVYGVAADENAVDLKVEEVLSQNVLDGKGTPLNTIGNVLNGEYVVAASGDPLENLSGFRIDTASPSSSSITINNNDVETTNQQVTLKVHTQDNLELSGMQLQLSNNGTTWCDKSMTPSTDGAYNPAITLDANGDATIANWNLLNADCGGTTPLSNKEAITVSARFIDSAQNPAETTSDQIDYDGVLPVIISVTTTTLNGTYGPNSTTKTIPITVTYNEELSPTLLSSITLNFNSGGSATLNSVSGNTLSGEYTIAAGDNTELGSFLSVQANNLTQSVFDTAGNQQTSSSLTGTNLNSASEIIIDSAAPTAIDPTGFLRLDRASEVGKIKVTIKPYDGGFDLGGMHAEIKLLETNAACTYTDAYQEPLSGETTFTYDDTDSSIKKACLKFTDKVGNISEDIITITPNTPDNFTYTDLTSDTFAGAIIKWDEPSFEGTGNFKKYHVLRCEGQGCVPTKNQEVTSESQNYYVYDGLTRGVTYCYSVAIEDNNSDISKYPTPACYAPGEGPVLADTDVNFESEPYVVNITKTSAEIIFKTVNGNDGNSALATTAEIKVYDDEALTNLVTSKSDPLSVTHIVNIAGLSASTKYYLEISATDTSVESNPNRTELAKFNKAIDPLKYSFTTGGILTTIDNIKESLITDTKAVITFNTNQEAKCFIDVKEATAASYIKVADNLESDFFTNHSITLVDLLPKTVHDYKITCSDGVTVPPITSDERHFTTQEKGLTQGDFDATFDKVAPEITNVSLTEVTGENATITWSTSEVANSLLAYEIEGADFMLMAGDYAVNADSQKYAAAHSVQLKNLLPASKYLFSVISTDASGNIAQSTQSSFTTKEPSSLSSIKVISKSLGQATITWETGGATSSTVEYGLTTSYGQKKEDSSKTKEHEVTLSDLTPGETYHFRVKGEDDQKNIFASSDITFQPKAPPKISDFKIDSITEHGATITFITNVPTDSLITYADLKEEDNSGFQGRPDIATKHEVKLKDLASGREFSIKLKVRDEEGNETEETFPNFTTTKDEKPPVIERVKTDSALTQNDKVQAIISWSTDEMATGTLIYREGKAGEEKKFEVNSAEAFSHVGVITSFKPGVVYYFNVRSADAAGNTAKSTDYALLTPKKRQNIIQIIIGNFTDIFGWAKF